MPVKISRYLIESELGRGAFGTVYLAYDTELDRKVAIKVFREVAESGLNPERELHALARLDHPGIVPVYDTGIHEDCPYFVAKYVSGPTLSECLRSRTFPPSAAAELVAKICEAVEHAHSRGVILRDIKPSNIILEDGTRPILIDFGIALFESDFGIDPLRSAGTLAYMCPEQASGSGHLLDARSDVYSLGAILYELLSGRVPFDGNTQTTVTKIRQSEPARPSLRNRDIPDGLEQICTKALSKSPSGRYHGAAEMAAVLRAPSLGLASPTQPAPPSFTPKGLRAFDAEDADAFLDLLPGPLSASGLPESVHFWTTRIGSHPQSPPSTERIKIGVIHGLSGSGKSSLLRAGILPRLHDSVDTIFTEAAGGTIEQRLLSSLRNFHPEIDPCSDLPTAIRAIREQDEHRTLLIAIDQFEQWLRDWDGGHGNELVRALRACDGKLIQCVIVVRDDFWTRMCQFMEAVECELHQNHNTRAAEIFDPGHAREILTRFGKALGALPEEPDASQRGFVEQAITALADESEGKVSPVQIALFAEVFKSRPWEVEELKKIGGARAVGPLFLDQAFLHRTAPTRNRFHAEAAARVLESLLPVGDLEIRGAAKGVNEICEVSGYANNSQAFCHLLQILDGELRLITPHGSGPNNDTASYQLTHDYLVPSIRSWLDLQRADTVRGRAGLRLEQLAAAYAIDQDQRHIPKILDFSRILAFTERRRWSKDERRLMYLAGRRAMVGSLLTMLAIGTLIVVGLKMRGAAQVRAWIADLRTIQTAEISPLLTERFPREKVEPDDLRHHFDAAERGSAQRFNLGLALIQLDPSEELAAKLFQQLLAARPREFSATYPILLSHDPKFSARALATADSPVTLPALVAGIPKLSLAEAKPAIERFLDQSPETLAQWVAVMPAAQRLRELLNEFELPQPAGDAEAEEPPFDPVRERWLAMSTLTRHLLGDPSAIYALLEKEGIPVRQAYVINAVVPEVIPDTDLLSHLESQPPPPPRVAAAVLLALQAYSPAGHAPPRGHLKIAENTIAIADDAYLHSAAQSLFRHWQLAVPEIRKEIPAVGDDHNWFNTGDQSKMVIIHPPPGDESIPHPFAITTTPVSFDRYKSRVEIDNGIKGGEAPGLPVHGLNLFHAMRYCNAASAAEGLEPCYAPSADGFGNWEPVQDYLTKSGYRLPTSAEMELASRGTAIPCPVPAEVIDLVDRYEWTLQNSGRKANVPGQLRPNEFGLFDTLANFSEWLFDPVELDDALIGRDRRMAIETHSRQRSANFLTYADLIEVGHSFGMVPQHMLDGTSFRLVRSLPDRARSTE